MGEIVLIQPASTRLLSLLALVIGLVLIAILVFGEHTRRTTVSGKLQPQSGLVSVQAAQAGRIVHRHIAEGSVVKTGQPLFHVQAPMHSVEGENLGESLSNQFKLRADLHARESTQQQQLFDSERSRVRREIAGLNQESRQIGASLGLQQRRLRAAKKLADSYATLVVDGHVSREQHEIRVADAIDQENLVSSLMRDLARVSREINTRTAELEVMARRHSQSMSRLTRETSDNELRRLETESRIGTTIVAPVPGVATALLAEQGQQVTPGQTLMSIVPLDTPLIAHLYAPSRSIGFIRIGTPVRIRLQAFPYQKFGQLEGRVISVSSSPIGAQDIPPSEANRSEPLFLIRASLSRQTISGNGKDLSMQAGMLLEADLLNESRKIYEWALEPLLGLKKRISAQ